MIEFDWDPKKAAANLKKHGISFPEAQSVFYDDYALQFYDNDHSDKEDRFIMLGMSNQSRVLVVVHCLRSEGTTIRIVSARKATANERSYYKGPVK